MKSYPIAEAKSQLARLVHQVEAGSHDVWDAVRNLRGSHDMEALDIDPDEIFASERDPSSGRDFAGGGTLKS